MAVKVVSYESPQRLVVTAYELVEGVYRTRLSQRTFSSTQRNQRDRYVEDLMTQYAAQGAVLRTMDATDDWNEADPRERERRGL